MVRFTVVSVSVLLAFLMISSCCHKKVYCSSEKLDFAFTGFVRSDVRSFTLRRYAEGDQWGKVLDSSQFIYYGSAQVTTKPDTLPFSDYRTVGNLPGITAGNDWAIYLPAINKVYFITTIFDDQNKSQLIKCGDRKTNCYKAITNFAINGDWQNGGFIYIQKGKW